MNYFLSSMLSCIITSHRIKTMRSQPVLPWTTMMPPAASAHRSVMHPKLQHLRGSVCGQKLIWSYYIKTETQVSTMVPAMPPSTATPEPDAADLLLQLTCCCSRRVSISDKTFGKVHAHDRVHTHTNSASKHINRALFDQRNYNCVQMCVWCQRHCVHMGPAVLCFSIEVLSDGQQETQTT